MPTSAVVLGLVAAAVLATGAVLALTGVRHGQRWSWAILGTGLLLLAIGTVIVLLPLPLGATARARHFTLDAGILAAVSLLLLAALVATEFLVSRLRRDSMEMERLQENLQDAVGRYQLLVESIPEAFVLLSEGRIEFVNQSFESVFGIDPEAAIGRTFSELVDPSDRHKTVPVGTSGGGVRSSWHGAHGTVVYQHPRSGRRWLDVRLEPVGGNEGGATAVGLISDVTDLKYTEQVRSVAYEISEAAARARDLESFFEAVHRALGRVVDNRNFFIALLDREAEQITFPFYRDEIEPEPPGPMPPGKTLTGYVLRTGRSLLADPAVFKALCESGEVELVGANSVDWLGVPLQVAGRTIGVVVVQTYDDTRLDERDETLMAHVAREVARAIEHHQATSALRDSEHHHRLIFQGSPAGILHFDRDGRITSFNERLVEILGSDPDRLDGFDLRAIEDRRIGPTVEAALKGEGASYEGWYQPTTGSETVYIQLRSRPLFGDDGEVVGGVAIMQDHTARRLAEESLVRRDAVLSAVSYAASRFLECEDPQGVLDDVLGRLGHALEVDRVTFFEIRRTVDGRVLATERTEWSAEGITSQRADTELEALDLGAKGLGDWVARFERKEATHGSVKTFARPVREFFQSRGILSLAVVPVFIRDRLWGFMGFDECHRERTWSIPEIEALGLAAGMLGAALQRIEAEAQLLTARKMEAIGQLAGGIAHDFNNLLMTIHGATDRLLGEGDLVREQLRHVVLIHDAAERAAALTRHLLAFARRQVIAPVQVDLNELVKGFLPTLRRVLPETVGLDFIEGHSLGVVAADPNQIEQILLNLSINARDAMPGGGSITFETENVLVGGEFVAAHPWAMEGRYVLLTASDTGHGMDHETLEHIFEPFFTTKPAAEGTGLGLATVYGIVKQHDGMIHVYSEPEKGTTFKIYLPEIERRASEVGSKISIPVQGGSETLLVVEDDPGVREVMIGLLGDLGYRVLSADDGLTAMNVLRERAGRVALVISDIVMPRMGGQELLEAAGSEWPGLRFLFTTGYSENVVHEGFVRKEGVTFLTKPFGRDTLARRVREALVEGVGLRDGRSPR
jgi:PAS domain S-box-containing protein